MASAARTAPHQNNWATGAFMDREVPLPPAQPTEFERLVARLGIASLPHLWHRERALRLWARKNRNKRYIPEELLAAWEMRVLVDD